LFTQLDYVKHEEVKHE
jgi:hypothetical protein